MKNTKHNIKRLNDAEMMLYRLRDEMTDEEEQYSPVNPMLDWIRHKENDIRKKRNENNT